jgi:NadR type nicotinamide-nucleotide adenylyltransferase
MEKRFKDGLVLGKFYPPHKGHFYLMDSAIEQCERVHILVCSLESEEIKGELRASWIWLHYFNNPNVNVIHIINENPQYPDECDSDDEFYDIWVKTVYDKIDRLDAVFTSEDYGEIFSKYLGVENVLVDKARITFPVSGTAVRNDAHSNWDLITDPVRDHFRHKVVIVGPESTGKSTLTKQLAEHYNGGLLEEYGREYTDDNIASEMTPDDYVHIARKHQDKLQQLNSSTDKRIIFSDTEAIVTKTFAKMYSVYDEAMDKELDRIIKFQSGWFHLYILIYPNIPWDDDGTRDFPDFKDRLRHFLLIKGELIKNNTPYVVIGGQNSFSTSTRIIDEKLATMGKII